MDHRSRLEQFVDGRLDNVAAGLRPLLEASGLCWLTAAARRSAWRLRGRVAGRRSIQLRRRPGRP